jgi:TolA-binding protein
MEAPMTLGPDARALLDAANGGDEPSHDDAARVRSKLAARIAMGAAAGAAATVATKGAAAGTTGAGAATGLTASAGVVTKALLAIALVGGTAATGAVVLQQAPVSANVSAESTARRGAEAAKPIPVVASQEMPAPIVAVSETSVDVHALPLASANTVEPVAIPAPVVRTPPPPRTTSATPAPLDAPAKPAADSIAEEAALLRAANAALTSGDATTALARLDEHAARYPNGALTQERQAARVFALCAGGRAAEARAAASSFVAANPRSPHVAQVRRSCASSSAE